MNPICCTEGKQTQRLDVGLVLFVRVMHARAHTSTAANETPWRRPSDILSMAVRENDKGGTAQNNVKYKEKEARNAVKSPQYGMFCPPHNFGVCSTPCKDSCLQAMHTAKDITGNFCFRKVFDGEGRFGS